MIDFITFYARRALLLAALVLVASFGAGFALRAWLGRPIATEFACPRAPTALHVSADKPSDDSKVPSAIARLVLFEINEHIAVIEFVSPDGHVAVVGAKDCAENEKCKAQVEYMAEHEPQNVVVVNVTMKTGIET